MVWKSPTTNAVARPTLKTMSISLPALSDVVASVVEVGLDLIVTCQLFATKYFAVTLLALVAHNALFSLQGI
jgi:hypothetical protein